MDSQPHEHMHKEHVSSRTPSSLALTHTSPDFNQVSIPISTPHTHVCTTSLHPHRYSRICAEHRPTDGGLVFTGTRNVSPSRFLSASRKCPTFTKQVSGPTQVSCIFMSVLLHDHRLSPELSVLDGHASYCKSFGRRIDARRRDERAYPCQKISRGFPRVNVSDGHQGLPCYSLNLK